MNYHICVSRRVAVLSPAHVSLVAHMSCDPCPVLRASYLAAFSIGSFLKCLYVTKALRLGERWYLFLLFLSFFFFLVVSECWNSCPKKGLNELWHSARSFFASFLSKDALWDLVAWVYFRGRDWRWRDCRDESRFNTCQVRGSFCMNVEISLDSEPCELHHHVRHYLCHFSRKPLCLDVSGLAKCSGYSFFALTD